MEFNRMKQNTLSLLVPMFNEQDSIVVFFERLKGTLSKINMEWEVICVDDGSSDNTAQLILEECENEPRVKLISFSRNFGKESAMTAALDYARGDAIIPIDADLQDPPELIIDMIRLWREGYKVINAKRCTRDGDSFMKRHSARWFYSIFNKLSKTELVENVGDFRLIDVSVADIIRKMPERDRFMKGLFSWPGFKSVTIEFERPERSSGTTKFNYWSLWNFALSGITSFSTLPIRFGIYLGFIIAFLAFVYSLVIVTRTIVLGIDIPGYASLLVVTLFLGGVQLFSLGLLGEYIGRIYIEVKKRPLYIVENAVGFDD